LKHTLYKIVVLLMFISVAANPGFSEDASEPEVNPIEPEAMNILMDVAKKLSTVKKVKVKIKNGYDAVQRDGQKIEFGSLMVVKHKRPNLCRVDVTELDGTEKGFVFDGNNITVFDEEEKVYAMIPKPGTCDDAIEYYKQELQMPLPLSELFDSKLPQMLKEKITEGYLVEESKLGDDPVTHVAFRTEEVDFQVWVDTKKNLPKRVIISYKNALEHPQYWAYFKEWDLSPRLKDSEFKYEPPKSYEKIVFSPVKIMEMKEEKKNVEK